MTTIADFTVETNSGQQLDLSENSVSDLSVLANLTSLTHLDLAETYLDRLSDAQSALRNLGAALQQAPLDVVVSKRANGHCLL